MQTPERSFGFLRWGNFAFTHAREQGFAEELKKNGLSYSVLEIQQQSRHHSIQSIKKWLNSTKFPAAIMATTDDVAIFFMQICETLGVEVPRQVSVLGVNNIPLICEMFTPTLSSIQRNGEDIGIEAAKLLHRLMNGENLDYQSIKIPPVSVIQRASTSFMYSDNIEVDEAMRYIHNHANQPIAVPDVVNAVNITRRTLENRFRKHLNSSIYDKIRLAHVKYACNMLIETNIAVSRIAHESGFNDKGRLYSSFNKLMKMTPEQYRKKNTLKK
jgi:LacI family transcriptional regulator